MERNGILVMIIEDEEALLQAISQKLTKSGFETITCTTATQALNYLKELRRLPDVIWLDYYLEDMDGLEFMNKMNENPEWKKLPVVVVSNSASPQKVQSMMDRGVKRYLLKADYQLKEIADILLEYTKNGKQKVG